MSESKYDELWRRTRLKFLELAEGRTGSMDKGSPPADPDFAPPSAGEEVREFDARWAGCTSDRHRREVLWDAFAYLRAHLIPNADIRHHKGTAEWREAVARDPRPSRVVADMYGTSHQNVVRWRKEFECV